MNTCYAKVIGGIGNQLFITAAAYAYAKKHNMRFVIDASGWSATQGTHAHSYRDTIFKNFEFETAPSNDIQHISEARFNYDELPKPASSVALHGYFQSLKYFQDVKDEFISLLNLPTINTDYIKPDNVAIHIRRGDYLQFAHIHLVCGVDYFKTQIDNFQGYQKNVFTDSPSHVQNELAGVDVNILKSKSDLLDLAHMSQHDNLICSNSSFSWWASLLGKRKKKIIVPDRWFNNFQNHDDIYRDDFIKVKSL